MSWVAKGFIYERFHSSWFCSSRRSRSSPGESGPPPRRRGAGGTAGHPGPGVPLGPGRLPPKPSQQDIQCLCGFAEVVERHGEKLVVQVESSFTRAATESDAQSSLTSRPGATRSASTSTKMPTWAGDHELLTPEKWCRTCGERSGSSTRPGYGGGSGTGAGGTPPPGPSKPRVVPASASTEIGRIPVLKGPMRS